MTKPRSSTQKERKGRKSGHPRVHLSPAKAKVKHKQWSEESMLAALTSLCDGTPIYRAAKIQGVPRSALHD